MTVNYLLKLLHNGSNLHEPLQILFPRRDSIYSVLYQKPASVSLGWFANGIHGTEMFSII